MKLDGLKLLRVILGYVLWIQSWISNDYFSIFPFNDHLSYFSHIVQQCAQTLHPSTRFLSIFSPYRSSSIFLTSRCLTYFLRLLQCSSPLYREKHTHRHAEALNHPPTPLPALLSQGSWIAPVGPAQWAPLLDKHIQVSLEQIKQMRGSLS